MNRLRYLLVLSVVAPWAVSAHAEDATGSQTAIAPNAAGIYWQAFAAMPNLSDEQKKILETVTASTSAPLTDDLGPVVARFGAALHEMHRARSVAPCDWQLDIEAGPELLLPHLQKARELGRVALVRARQRFAAGESDAAVTDVLAVLKMARDCGSSPILISFLVDASIEKSAIEVLAGHLPLLKKEQLDQLAASLRELPATSNVAASIRTEERLFCDWLESKLDIGAAQLTASQASGKLLAAIADPSGLESELNPKPDDIEGKRNAELLKADVRASLQRLRSDYAELSKIAALPFDERTAQLDAFEDSLTAARNPKTGEDALRRLSTWYLPSLKNVFVREEQLLTRRQLLEQAIRVQRDGADALQAIRGKKVEHHKTGTGFELRCPCGKSQDVLAIGRP